MRTTNRYIATVATTLLVCASTLYAASTANNDTTQRGVAAFREQLCAEPDPTHNSSVTIREDASARRALEPYEALQSTAEMDGFRVGVYFDNSAQGRSGAMEVMHRCDSLLRDIPATMSYDNPYFKVSVGYCTSEEEAVALLNRVQRHFPKAYLLRERISVDDIIAAREKEIEARNTNLNEEEADAEE